MSLRLSAIASALSLELDGEDILVTHPALVEDAGPGTLCLATTAEYARQAKELGSSAVLAKPGIEAGLPTLLSDKPRVAFARVLGLFDDRPTPPAGIHPAAVVSETATVSATASIGPRAVVEADASIGDGTAIGAGTYVGHGTQIGRDCDIGPGVVIYHRCTLGDRVRLAGGTVIGAEGYGYEWDGAEHVRVPHIGTVVLEDDVDIGANCCVDRAKTAETRVGRGTKIDNLVQIAHGAIIGPFSLMAAQVGIAGSAHVGAGVVMAGQSGVVDGATVGPGAIVAAQSGVMGSVAGGKTYMGTPAREVAEMRRVIAALPRLPSVLGRIRALERRFGRDEEQGHTEEP
ncbi:MAG TPA: UDP-3-O-(3-hydroxymyristoyl)glucosamine N-acyltransferase [Armatimonadota bacterium]|jgi:UDP-3-O-[3-hydroxymyristoyl] glucosamine N-acyltransferase